MCSVRFLYFYSELRTEGGHVTKSVYARPTATPRRLLLEDQQQAAVEEDRKERHQQCRDHGEATQVANTVGTNEHERHYMQDEDVVGVVFDRHRRGRAGPGGGGNPSLSPASTGASGHRSRFEGRLPPSTLLTSFKPKAVGLHTPLANLKSRRVLHAPQRRQKAAPCTKTVSWGA